MPCPVEIIDYILDFAAAFPNLTTHLLLPYFIHTGDHDLPLPAIKFATRSLLSLALVCRQWNTICTPKLYRCLAIDDPTSIGVLLRILDTDNGR
jgi:F-box-like